MEAPVIIDPVMSDAIIAKIQEGLKNNLSWLDVAFGRAERIIKQIEGRNFYVPAIYTGTSFNSNEYLELSPDAQIGNFSFFWMMDPQRFAWESISIKERGIIKEPYALILWFDLRKVYNTATNRNILTLENEVLHVLREKIFPISGSFTIDKIYHLAENIYREFNIAQVDNQFLMHPYAGFRIEGELIYNEPCYD